MDPLPVKKEHVKSGKEKCNHMKQNGQRKKTAIVDDNVEYWDEMCACIKINRILYVKEPHLSVAFLGLAKQCRDCPSKNGNQLKYADPRGS